MELELATALPRVRRARLTEAAHAAFLLRVSFAEVAALYTPEALEATLADVETFRRRMRGEGVVWLAFQGTRAVGTVSALPKTEGLHLRSMAVHPEARGQGVGRVLLGVAEQFAVDRGHARIFLRTTPFLTSAIALYSRAGFTMREGAERDFHGVPLFEMEKSL
jgi:GNAT superfamily N-acetyltransferase